MHEDLVGTLALPLPTPILSDNTLQNVHRNRTDVDFFYLHPFFRLKVCELWRRDFHFNKQQKAPQQKQQYSTLRSLAPSWRTREKERKHTHTHKMYSGEYGINRSDLNLWFKLKVPFTDIVVEWNFINLTSFFPKAFEAFYMCLGAFWLENMRSIVKKNFRVKREQKGQARVRKKLYLKI